MRIHRLDKSAVAEQASSTGSILQLDKSGVAEQASNTESILQLDKPGVTYVHSVRTYSAAYGHSDISTYMIQGDNSGLTSALEEPL
jgi:hypothetical protein